MSQAESLLGSLPPLMVERRAIVSREESNESDSEEAVLTESDSENVQTDTDSDTNNELNEFSGSDSEQYPVHMEPFRIQDAEKTAIALSTSFRVFHPGKYVCKRNREHGTSFSHCLVGVPLAEQYSTLRNLMERRAKLQLVKDYNNRIHSFSHFVFALELTVKEELQTFYAITHQHCQQDTAPMTKLESLSAICEELRIHVNHWNSIKQHFHTSKWLRPYVPRLCLEMYKVHAVFTELRDNALWWIDKLINTGLKVFAHTDLERATPEALWSITRGIEEFNTILNVIRAGMLHEDTLQVNKTCDVGNTRLSYHATQSNKSGHIGSSVKPVPFSRVLNILAHERSKYAAGLTYHFFAENKQFLHLIHNNQLAEYSWVLPTVAKGDNSKNKVNTSDYHTSSSTSLSDSMLKIGNLKAPDLSQETSPLIDFANQEEEFAGKFLSIVCSSTNLLRKGVTGPSQIGRKTPQHAKTNSPFSRQDPKRKSVSWGDAADTSVKLQLTHKYMDLLWQNFGSHLEKLFCDMTWGVGAVSRGHLGNLMMCAPSVSMVLVQMMKQVYFKDLFPSGADSSLLDVARTLHARVAMAIWDLGICSATASVVSDKCRPIMLADDLYTTHTAKLICDAYHPLTSILQAVEERYFQSVDGKGPSSPNRMADLALLLPTLSRLLMTCNLALSWCQIKSQQLLASRMTESFLLVIQSDLKVLGDEIKKVLCIPKSNIMDNHHGSSQLESQLSMAVSALWHQLNDTVAQHQTLSGTSMKIFSSNVHDFAREFFQNAMPVTKVWRKKSTLDFPTEPSEYAMQAMDAILDPVLNGVSKLQTTAQLSVTSTVVVVMCDSWTEHILKEKIKFSLYGAHQLSLDFVFLKTYIDEFIQQEDVKQSILALDVFKYLSGVIQLLKRQPKRRQRLREEPSTEYSESTSNDHVGSSSAISASDDLDIAPDDSGEDADAVWNSNEWLALRVHGGTRNWRLPMCFPSSAEN